MGSPPPTIKHGLDERKKPMISAFAPRRASQPGRSHRVDAARVTKAFCRLLLLMRECGRPIRATRRGFPLVEVETPAARAAFEGGG